MCFDSIPLNFFRMDKNQKYTYSFSNYIVNNTYLITFRSVNNQSQDTRKWIKIDHDSVLSSLNVKNLEINSSE